MCFVQALSAKLIGEAIQNNPAFLALRRIEVSKECWTSENDFMFSLAQLFVWTICAEQSVQASSHKDVMSHIQPLCIFNKMACSCLCWSSSDVRLCASVTFFAGSLQARKRSCIISLTWINALQENPKMSQDEGQHATSLFLCLNAKGFAHIGYPHRMHAHAVPMACVVRRPATSRPPLQIPRIAFSWTLTACWWIWYGFPPTLGIDN